MSVKLAGIEFIKWTGVRTLAERFYAKAATAITTSRVPIAEMCSPLKKCGAISVVAGVPPRDYMILVPSTRRIIMNTLARAGDLDSSLKPPDATTIWIFRETLGELKPMAR
jgi:hypothetical protein